MPTIIEINVQTNERTEREMTSEEIEALYQLPAAHPDVAGLLGPQPSGTASQIA